MLMLNVIYAEWRLCCVAHKSFMLSLAPLVYRYAAWVTKMFDMHFTHTDYYRAETTKESLLKGKDQYNLPLSTN